MDGKTLHRTEAPTVQKAVTRSAAVKVESALHAPSQSCHLQGDPVKTSPAGATDVRSDHLTPNSPDVVAMVDIVLSGPKLPNQIDQSLFAGRIGDQPLLSSW